ncbi:MAG: Rieske (2Fe-2S) protein [Chloroflexota bacterium]
MTYYPAVRTDELADGNMKSVPVEGHELLIARVGNKYYAADNRCPHMGGRLAQGSLEGTVVTCPLHASRFDLADGKVLRWTDFSRPVVTLMKIFKPARPLRVYPVKIEGENLLVEV